MKKKIFITLITILMLTSISFGYTKIYDLTTETPISSGVNLKNIRRFITGGWLNINILEVDLTDPYVKVDMLTPENGMYSIDTVYNQAVAAEAIGAVNADFFTWVNNSKNGIPIGFGMKDGIITSGMYYKNATTNAMATFVLSDTNIPYYEYITAQEINLVNEDDEKVKVGDINTTSSDYLNPIVYTTAFRKTSIGKTDAIQDILEIVVEDNEVLEIRRGMESVAIPEDGYVVTTAGSIADTLESMFKKGDEILLDAKITPDMSDKKVAVSGGAILVSNGTVLTSFTHNLEGYQPRTAVGSNKEGTMMYLVTVDGRQAISNGVTQTELAYLMNEIGAYNALNLDGGGSTMMVGRLPGDYAVNIINSPTEKRKVVNSLGIFSLAPKNGKLEELKVTSNKSQIFIGDSVLLEVKGYDKNYSPYWIEKSDIKWKVSGVDGKVVDGKFTPKSTGIAKITAEYEKKKQTIEIRVMDIAEIEIDVRTLSLNVGDSKNLTIKVKDSEGYTADFSKSKLKFTSSNSKTVIDANGKITAKEPGESLITVSYNDKIKAFVGVVNSGTQIEVLEEFEKLNTTFLAYPKDVKGDVELSTKQKHNGKSSMVISYDFSKDKKTKAVYAVFAKPKEIEAGSKTLKLWAYTKKEQPDVMVKMQFTDADGNSQLLEVLKSADFTGWKELSLDLSSIKLPAQLQRIYVAVQDTKGPKSEMYFDDLSLEKVMKGNINNIKIYDNTMPKDEQNKESKKDGEVVVFGNGVSERKTLFEDIRIRHIEDAIGKEIDYMIVNTGEALPSAKQSTKMGKYSIGESENAVFLKVNNSNGGIRKTNADQWNWFIGKLEKVEKKNLFIIMPSPVIQSFSDKAELEVFETLLKEYEERTGGNVIILEGNNVCKHSYNNGFKYISLDKSTGSVLNRINNEKYVIFNVTKDEVTYQIKNIFE